MCRGWVRGGMERRVFVFCCEVGDWIEMAIDLEQLGTDLL